MITRTQSRLLRRTTGLILALAALSSFGSNQDTYEEQEQRSLLNPGTDPWSYATAEAMYEQGPPAKPFDAEAQQMVAAIARKLQDGVLPEDDEVWRMLGALNPFRTADEVQAAVENWAVQCAGRITAQVSGSDDPQFARANAEYNQPGQAGLSRAADGYREVLRRRPGHLDARNNLALAAMHLNSDLAAQLQFAILMKADGSYVPAQINTTVLLERLGKSEEAADLAQRIVVVCTNLPAAVYNAAWYQDLRGDRETAGRLLANVAFPGVYLGGKHELLAAALRPFYVPPGASGIGFWRNGLAGLLGARESDAARILALIAFSVITVILLSICVAIGKQSRKGQGGFWWFVVLGGLAYVLYWGCQPAMWWPVLIYVAIFGGLSAAAAKS
jgi:hypothetical protein